MNYENLQFPEPIEVVIKPLDNMKVMVKSYLLSRELKSIVLTVKDMDDIINRDIMVKCMLIHFCCSESLGLVEINGNEITTDNELYDLYSINGVIDSILDIVDEKYIYDIDLYIDEYNSVSSHIKEVSNNIETSLNKANIVLEKVSKKGFNFKNVIEQLKDAQLLLEKNKLNEKS